MRIRTVKPAFFTDDRLAALPPLTRILFQGLWCMADRAGRLEDRPLRIKALVLPYDDHDIDAALAELTSAGFISRYEVSGQKLIEIPGLPRNQHFNVKEPASTLPAPTSTAPAPRRHRAGTGPKRQEGKGTGREQEGKGTIQDACDANTGFDAFWSAYPKKVGKGAAEKAWGRIKPCPDLVASMLAAVDAQVGSDQWQRGFVPNPATWLNEGRWQDELAPAGQQRKLESKRTEGNLAVGEAWLKQGALA